jgi:hypothetical protein
MTLQNCDNSCLHITWARSEMTCSCNTRWAWIFVSFGQLVSSGEAACCARHIVMRWYVRHFCVLIVGLEVFNGQVI